MYMCVHVEHLLVWCLNFVQAIAFVERWIYHSLRVCVLQDCISVLLSSVAGIQDSGDGEGRTALMWASQRGNYAVLKALLQAGCDPNTVDHFGATGQQQGVQRSCNYKYWRGKPGNEANVVWVAIVGWFLLLLHFQFQVVKIMLYLS